MSHFDVIVLGLGGMGSACCWQLARRGARVLGLEQHDRRHDLGSSHGLTRIIRTAYFEHPAYVPLVRRAFAGWYELEQLTGRHLLTECPCLTVGPPEGELVAGVLRSAVEHDLPVEKLSAADVRRRYPAFVVQDPLLGVVERSAGVLLVEECVEAAAEEAARQGAELRYQEPVQDWEVGAGGVRVRTARGSYTSSRLIVCAGAWAGRVLARVGLPLTVMRQVAFWLMPRELSAFRRDRFPVFIVDTPEGYYYGFPARDRHGLKVARHYGAAELPGPEEVDRVVHDSDEEPVRKFVREYLPLADGPRMKSSVCLYTLTPDRHFVLDTLPGQPEVAVAAGFSGHGFKFAPVVGEALAELALAGRTQLPIDLFTIGRFAAPGA